jgi:2Fe-2S ferredoxin
MAILRILYETGDPEKVIEFDPQHAPFQHDGQAGSILDVMLGHDIPLEHACGGNCACTTCHVIVKSGMQNLSENEESEDDLLDRAPGLTPTSRLGCQAVFEKDGEVMIVVPRYTINQQVG